MGKLIVGVAGVFVMGLISLATFVILTLVSIMSTVTGTAIAPADAATTAPTAAPPPYFDSGGPVQVTYAAGYTVHVDIAPQVRLLVAHAQMDGHSLGGWAFRSHEEQKRLRREHCGPTRGYDPGDYTVRSSSCRPPTATPGNSMHEVGKAIDFTCNGRSFGGTACWFWAKRDIVLDPRTCRPTESGGTFYPDRLHCYGLYNLPSEPWHWSTTGT